MNGYPEGPEATRRHRELSRRFLAEQLSQTAWPVILLDRCELAREVYTIEIVPQPADHARNTLAALGYRNVHVRTGDGYLGWPEQAPFDAIMVTAAPDHVPQPLVDQLAVGRRMIIPVGAGYQEILLVSRTPTGIVQHRTIPVRFVPLVRPPR
jgi:protein-L-isoaspartate(D-aspartate) O-methyltransferase